MDQNVVNLIGQFPIIAIVIYLLYRESLKTEKLLAELLEQSKQHSKDLVEMAINGYGRRTEDAVKK